MRHLLNTLLFILFTSAANAQQATIDLKAFAQTYFKAFVVTQTPDASKSALEDYLVLLKDDVGHTHLPWQTDDSRQPDGKKRMREGMTYYLGSHTEYSAELLDVFAFNDSAIAIRYQHSARGIHPESKQHIEYTEIMMEVLEMEDGKVAVIRKYHE